MHSQLGTGRHAQVDGEPARDSAGRASPLGSGYSEAAREGLKEAVVDSSSARGLEEAAASLK